MEEVTFLMIWSFWIFVLAFSLVSFSQFPMWLDLIIVFATSMMGLTLYNSITPIKKSQIKRL